jgi:hypothetical protein
MNRKTLRTIALRSIALVAVLGAACQAQAQDAKTPYPTMAPLDQYLIEDRNAEIALARSAAPESIARDAEVLVLGRHGFEIAVKGKNGFVCLVQRSWTAPTDNPEFWDPKLRSPICLNPPGARSYLPNTIKKTELALAGRSKEQISGNLKAAFDAKELSGPEPGAMGYMLSKQQYTSERDGHWHPHLMVFVPQTEASTWGANLQDSPIFCFKDAQEHLTMFLIPLGHWSDGTADTMNGQ